METMAQPYFYLLSRVFYPPFLLASFTTTHPSMMCGIQSSVVNRRQVSSVINAVTNHNHQKSCWCTRFAWSNGNVKGVPCSDKPSENYQLNLRLLWAIQDIQLIVQLWAFNFTVLVHCYVRDTQLVPTWMWWVPHDLLWFAGMWFLDSITARPFFLHGVCFC